MISPFEERLLETLFPDFVAWSADCIASYVMHRRDGNPPIFFKKLSDDVLDYALTHEKDFSVFSVKTDGSVDDVTEAWTRVFDKHKTTRGAVDALLARWAQHVPENVATMEVKAEGVTLGYFSKPSLEMLRCVDRVRDVSRLSVLVIHTTGVVKDVTTEWRPFFNDYIKLRFKDM